MKVLRFGMYMGEILSGILMTSITCLHSKIVEEDILEKDYQCQVSFVYTFNSLEGHRIRHAYTPHNTIETQLFVKMSVSALERHVSSCDTYDEDADHECDLAHASK